MMLSKMSSREGGRISVLLANTISAITLASAAASAQSSPTDSASPQAESFGDIVVTAQRRSEKQSQVPLSITAFNSKSLATTGVADSRALTQITPGLNFQSVGSSAQPQIRGIGSTGSSVGDSSNVALYIDGVYQPFQAANFLRFSDLERIEVLKGPQGTLFGRNAAGGAISIATREPELDEATGDISLSYGRFDEFEANGFVSLPVSQTVAVSLTGNYVTSDGFRKDINLDRRLGYVRAHSLRGKILLEPSDQFRALFTAYYRRTNDLTTFGNQPLDGNAMVRTLVPDVLVPSKPNTSALNLEPVNRVKSWGGSARLEYDFDFATLTSLTAFANVRQFVLTDSDLTPIAYSQSRIRFGDDMFSQDLTLTSNNDGPLTWLAGATYYKEDGFYYLRSYGGLRTPGNPPLTAGQSVPHIQISAIAAFGEVTYQLTDRLTAIAGARYSKDKPEFRGARVQPGTGAEDPASAAASKDSFSSFTPRVSLRYAATPTINAYASYSRGFKSGVFNANSLQTQAVKPEVVDAFEIGVKGTPSRALTFDAATYFYKYKDLQVASFGATSVSPTLRNAAKAEIYGFEANATVRPLEGLSLRGGLAYTHGEYTEFAGAQGFRPAVGPDGNLIGGNQSYIIDDASGNRLIRTPRLQVNGTLAYEAMLSNGGTVNMNLTGSHTGSMNHDIEGNIRQPGFTVFNTSVSYTTSDEHWRATLFGSNIFNEKYIAGILVSQIGTSVTYAKPTVYGVKLEYLF